MNPCSTRPTALDLEPVAVETSRAAEPSQVLPRVESLESDRDLADYVSRGLAGL